MAPAAEDLVGRVGAMEIVRAAAPEVDACVAQRPTAFGAGAQLEMSFTATRVDLSYDASGADPVTDAQWACLEAVGSRARAKFTHPPKDFWRAYYKL